MIGQTKHSAEIRNSLFRKWTIVFLSFLISSFFATTAFAENISGKVNNSEGIGIAGVYVKAYNAAGGTYFIGAFSQSDGSYAITGLPAGSYKLQFYGNNTGYVSQWYNNKTSQGLADTVTVTAGADRSGIDATLTLGHTISGKVINSAGTGIAGVYVKAYDATGGFYFIGASSQSGSYTIMGLPAGSYKVQFYGNNTGYISQWYNNKTSQGLADAVTVTADADTIDINATLSLGNTISGKVINSAETGIADVEVKAYDAAGGLYFSGAFSQADGSYAIMGLPAGSYKLLFDGLDKGYINQWYNNKISRDLADAVTVTAGADISEINATLVLVPVPVALSVTIEGNGSVNSDPAGIACTKGVCSATFDNGVKVKLMATTENSTFTRWTGACTNTTGDCYLTMNSPMEVTAIFTANPATVKIEGDTAPYYAIGSTLNGITTGGKTVRAKADSFIENVVMTNPVSILLKCGYTDSAFSARTRTSKTVIDGSLKIQKGKLRVERLVVR